MSDYLGNIKGPEGTPGPIGPHGPVGADGPQGPSGADGPQGPAGPIGPQGPAGVDGTVSFDELTPEQHNSLVGPQGPKGDTGDTGSDGEPGFSPTVQITEIENGTNVVITDFDGPKTFDVMNGEAGIEGPKGDTGNQGPKGDSGEQGPKGDPGNDNLNIFYKQELKENYKINFLSPSGDPYTGLVKLNGITLIDDNGNVVDKTFLNGIGGITYVGPNNFLGYTEVLTPDRFCTTEPYEEVLTLVDNMNNNTLVFNENKIVCGEFRRTSSMGIDSSFYNTTFTTIDREFSNLPYFKDNVRRLPFFSINTDFIYNGETYITNYNTVRNYDVTEYKVNLKEYKKIDFILDLVHTDESGIIDKMITCSFHYDSGVTFEFDSSKHLNRSNTIIITKI